MPQPSERTPILRAQAASRMVADVDLGRRFMGELLEGFDVDALVYAGGEVLATPCGRR